MMRELIRRILREESQMLTPEMVIKIASNYNTRKEFRQGSPRAYRKAIQYDLFGNGINHLGNTVKRKPAGYWTYDNVDIEAKKYTNRRDFQKGSPQAFASAKQHGWYNDVTSHMDYLGSLYRRAVYAWEFPNNTVYIGLTDDIARREGEHLDPEGRTTVSKFIKQTGLNPTLKIINDYTDVKDAQNIEKCSIDLYKSNGWNILNKVKAGGLGACKRVWNKENVEHEAKKYNTRSDFKKGNHSAYVIAVREGWIDDVTKHMNYKHIQWTEDMIIQIASKYNSLTMFLKNEPKAVVAARRIGIYDDIIKNMVRSTQDTTQSKYKSKDDVYNEIPKYSSITNLRDNDPSLYNYIRKNNMSDELRNYFNLKPKTEWTLELLKSISDNYKNRGELQKYNPTAYQQARKKGYLDILFPKNNK